LAGALAVALTVAPVPGGILGKLAPKLAPVVARGAAYELSKAAEIAIREGVVMSGKLAVKMGNDHLRALGRCIQGVMQAIATRGWVGFGMASGDCVGAVPRK
jgi:hypothetical protein